MVQLIISEKLRFQNCTVCPPRASSMVMTIQCALLRARLAVRARKQNPSIGSSAKSPYKHSVQIWRHKKSPPARSSGPLPQTKKCKCGRGQLACASAAGCKPAKFIEWQLGKITISTHCPNMAIQKHSARALRWSLRLPTSDKKNCKCRAWPVGLL